MLSFITAPDFENPADAGHNNIYEVTVRAADSSGGTDTQAIAVTVTDVNETITNGNGGGTLAGTPGNDVIDGKGGNDGINAGAGKDTITAGPGLDIVNAGDGDDTIVATIGDGSLDMYNDGAGTDTLNMSGITTPHHRQLGSLLRLEYSNRSGFYNLDRERHRRFWQRRHHRQ